MGINKKWVKIMAYTTFPDEIVLWHKNKYAIVEATMPNTGRRSIVVTDGWKTDYVVDYGNFKWAMDNPEWFPKYVKDALQRIINRRGYSAK
jgi:hypothetical protein